MTPLTKRLISKTEYTRRVDAVFLGLILQMLLFEISPGVTKILSDFMSAVGLSKNSALFSNVQSICSIILYCVSFLLPAFFISKSVFGESDLNDVCENESVAISLKAVYPDKFVLVVISALGCVSGASYITVTFAKLLEKVGIGFIAYTPAVPDDVFGIILLFVSSVLIPSFVEEILFRKAILGSLMKYGKWTAVIISSTAFSLMHRNPMQFIFTFIGGIFMGVLTVKCNSVIPAMILHFSNNALSFAYMLIGRFAGEKVYSYTVPTFELALNVAGAFCLVILILKKYFKLDGKQNDLGFSPVLNTVRLLPCFYVLFCLYLSTYWVKFI